MVNLDFQPKMVGREDEFKEIQAYLDKAAGGEGSTIFISGEAGIGKTRLVEELKQIAQSRDFQILSGNSMYESLTPFMPMMEALRSGGLESLFTEEAPKVEAVYLVTHSGLLIKDVVRQETKLDPELFSSVLTTLSDFASESLSALLGEKKEGTLNTLGFENYRILIKSGKNANLVVIISGKENEFLINDMKEIFLGTNKRYDKVLENWDGDREKVAGIEELLKTLITSGKYDGIYYGKEDPKIRRNLLFENVSLGLIRQAQQTPTLLCIEDLQWADPSSLALMHYISRNTKKNALLILGTYRPEDVTAAKGQSHPLIETMQLMDREDLSKKMELERLPEESITEFMSSLLGVVDLNEEFKYRIYKETEGNPLFIIQLIKYMVDEKIILEHDGIWDLVKDLKDIEIPSKIYNVIERRLNRLEKKDRKVLDYASVIGEMFNSTVLTEALGTNRTQLLEQLRGLEQTYRLIRSTKGNFKFDHAKIKEVLYSEIPEELRRVYHSIIANSIEELNKDNLDDVIGDLAFHYYHCKNREKALHYLIKAAEKAKKDYSNEEAVLFYTRALEFENNIKTGTQIFETLGDIYRLIGDFNGSQDYYEEALKFVQEKFKRAEIKTKIARLKFRSGKLDEMLKIATEAIELVKGEECKEEAYATWLIGSVHDRRGDVDRALKCFIKSLEIGQKLGDQLAIARSYGGVGSVYWNKGDYKKALEAFKKGLKSSEKTGEQWFVVVDLCNIGWIYLELKDYDKALEIFKKALNIQQKIGEQEGLSWTWWGFAEIYYGKKDMKRALDFINRAYELSKETGFKEVIAESSRMYGKIYCEQKKWKKSIENFKRSLIVFNEVGMKIRWAESHFEFGLMWKAKGDVDKAKEHFQKALDMFEELKIEKKMENVERALEAL